MENAKPNLGKVAFKWALISLVTSIVFTYVWQFANVNPTSPVVYVGFIPFIAFLLMAIKEYKDQSGGFIKFGEAFLAGFLFSVFAGLMTAVFTYVYYTILSPQAYQLILDAQRAGMEAKGLSSDQIDAGMEITTKYGTLITAIASIIVTPIIGAIIALIGAAIFKKERSPFDNESFTDPAV
jgi:hypothetical protein